MAWVGQMSMQAMAGAAMAGFGCVHRQRQVGVDLAEKEPRAVLPVQQQRVFAAPAEAGFAASSTSSTGALSVKTRK
jgi:hypothetical protein